MQTFFHSKFGDEICLCLLLFCFTVELRPVEEILRKSEGVCLKKRKITKNI